MLFVPTSGKTSADGVSGMTQNRVLVLASTFSVARIKIRDLFLLNSFTVNDSARNLHTNSLIPTLIAYSCSVHRHFLIIHLLQKAGEAKIGDFARQVGVHEDIPRSKITVYVAHLAQVLHAYRYVTQHTSKLDRRQEPFVVL